MTLTYETEVKAARHLVTVKRAELSVLQDDINVQTAAVSLAKEKAQHLSDSIIMTQSFSGSIQTGVIGKFEELLTRAVQEIFGRNYQVNIDLAAKGNSMWAEFHIVLPSGKKVSLTDGEGGGMKEVVAVLSRILYLVLDPTQPAKFMVLDENLGDLDEWRAPFAIPLITKIAKDLGIQIVFITHNKDLSAGDMSLQGADVYKFELVNDVTSISKVVMYEDSDRRKQGVPGPGQGAEICEEPFA